MPGRRSAERCCRLVVRTWRRIKHCGTARGGEIIQTSIEPDIQSLFKQIEVTKLHNSSFPCSLTRLIQDKKQLQIILRASWVYIGNQWSCFKIVICLGIFIYYIYSKKLRCKRHSCMQLMWKHSLLLFDGHPVKSKQHEREYSKVNSKNTEGYSFGF